MTKKSENPTMSKEELNNLLGIDKPYAVTGNDTASTLQTDDSEKKTIPEPVVSSEHEVVSASTVPVAAEIPSGYDASAESLSSSIATAPTPPDPIRRPSAKQRKASFEEYREAFLQAPKISDRQPVFLSRTTRDRLEEIVRKLGDRKMSVSGLLENIAQHHLEAYTEDIEVWKRL